MEEKEKDIIEEQKENSEPSNNEIQNYQHKIKELNNKINVLIKGVKEEREKSKKLAKELEVLNLDKILKEETISKLRSENESLNMILSKDDPKSYFENITKLNTDINFNPEEYDLMKKENVQLKEENKTLMEQNSILINKIEKLTEDKKLDEKNFNEEIYKLKKERIDQSNEIYDKQKKIEILNNLYKEIEIQKNNRENEIIKYKEEEKNFRNNIKKLENQIILLKNKNEKDNIEINKLKKEIEDRIKIEIDDYVFKGIIISDNFNKKKLWNKNISIKFSSTDIYIKLKIVNKNLKIDAKKIRFNFFENAKNKVIIFYDSEEEKEDDDNGEEEVNIIANEIKDENKEVKLKENEHINIITNEIKDENKEEKLKEKGKIEEEKNEKKYITNAMLCQFSERECNYIFEFKKEMMSKYKENKKNIEKEENSFTNFIFGFFN